MSNYPCQGLSIVICTWNRAESLRATLLSLSAQEAVAEHPLEVVVVDNNSSDHTKAVVDEWKARWTLGALRYVFEPCQGKQFALNRGIAHSTHDVLAFTDDDIAFEPTWTREILRIFSDSALELAGGKTLILWPDSGRPNWYHSSMSAIFGGVDLGDERLLPAPPEYAPAGANLVGRRSLFERIGNFSEKHFRHMDHEFGMRSQRMGAVISYEPSLLVYAPVDIDCLTKRYFQKWSFKAGIAREENPSESDVGFFGIPKWVYRRAFEDFFHLLLHQQSDPAHRFVRELRLWRSMGRISRGWHERFFPSRHSEWVKKHSQKNKNVY